MKSGAPRALLILGALVALPVVAVVALAPAGRPEKPLAEIPSARTATTQLAPATAATRKAPPKKPRPSPTPSARARPSAAPGSDGRVARALALERSDPARCRQLLRDIIASEPENVAAIEALSGKMLNDENHHEARELALRCLELDPLNEACDETRRFALTPYNADDKAAGFLANCLEKDPTSLPCLSGMIVEKVRLGEIDAARALSEKLSAAHPGQPMTDLSLGRVAAAELRYSDALQQFSKACDSGQEYSCHRAETLRAEGW